MSYSTDHIDYLSRSFLDSYGGRIPGSPEPGQMYFQSGEKRPFHHIKELNRSWQQSHAGFSNQEEKKYRSEDILAGLYGTKTPVVFSVEGIRNRIKIGVGSCDFLLDDQAPNANQEEASVIRHALQAQYPGVKMEAIQREVLLEALSQARYFGLMTGIPTPKSSDETDCPTQLDLLARTMANRNWGLLIIAQPLQPKQAQKLVHSVVKEMQEVEHLEHTKARYDPVAEHYYQLLNLMADEFREGSAIGVWTVSVYFYSDNRPSFDCLKANLAACFGGRRSLPDPIRVFEFPGLEKVISQLSLLLAPADDAPGNFHYPYRFQTLLTSEKLAALIHIPRLETPGLIIRDWAQLDVASHQPEIPPPGSVKLGEIVKMWREEGDQYHITPKGLNKHSLIVGATGSGKTNTSMYLLRQLWDKGTPFLVIEPAKKEYRSLLADPVIGSGLAVFTLGNEQIAPLRLNPFEFEPGIMLSTHIDLLKSVFNAAFSMWTVLPQILEQSIFAVYQAYGWDVVQNKNQRLLGEEGNRYRQDAFPTLTDLQHTIEEVVNRLGYEPKTTSDLKAALITRVQSLRIGGKGKMLDTRESFSMEKLLSAPAVIELEEIGDDDEKAFLIGLLLVRIYEYLRSKGEPKDKKLKHIVVVEEAHRLLSNVALHLSAEVSNIRGKAVETFVNMLSEVRAYGEGFFIAEQIPSKLHPDVIKNTNVKIVHRTVAGDDRELIGMAMNLPYEQQGILATLELGEAAVFSEGDDRPMRVRVKEYQPYPSGEAVVEKLVTAALVAEKAQQRCPEISKDCTYGCRHFLGKPPAYCDTVQQIAERDEFQKAVAVFHMSILEAPDSLAKGLDQLLRLAKRYYPGGAAHEDFALSLLIHAAGFHLSRLGRLYQWPFSELAGLREAIIPIFLDTWRQLQKKEKPDQATIERLKDYQNIYKAMCARRFDPYSECAKVCGQQPTPLCLYRYQVADLLNQPHLTTKYQRVSTEATDMDNLLERLKKASLEASEECLPESASTSAKTRLAACFGIQKLAEWEKYSPIQRAQLTKALIDEKMLPSVTAH